MIADFASLLVGLPGFEASTLIVERSSAPSGIDYLGTSIEAAASEVEMFMASHQATRKQLRREQLDHAEDFRAFYGSTRLQTAGEGIRPDVIRFGGERWEVQNVGDYGTLGNIFLALAKRIE